MNLIDDVALPGSLRAIMFSIGLSLTWQDVQSTPMGLVLCIIFVLVMRNVMARHRQEQAPLRAAQGGS